jgi:hypothetical protein
MGQNPGSEADSRSPSHAFSGLLSNPKIHDLFFILIPFCVPLPILTFLAV